MKKISTHVWILANHWHFLLANHLYVIIFVVVERNSFVVARECNVIVDQVHLLLDLLSGEISSRRQHHGRMLVVVIRRNVFVVSVRCRLMIVEQKFGEAGANFLLVHHCERASAFRWGWWNYWPVGFFLLILYRQLAHIFVQLCQHLICICVVNRYFGQVLSFRCKARHLRRLWWRRRIAVIGVSWLQNAFGLNWRSSLIILVCFWWGWNVCRCRFDVHLLEASRGCCDLTRWCVAVAVVWLQSENLLNSARVLLILSIILFFIFFLLGTSLEVTFKHQCL